MSDQQLISENIYKKKFLKIYDFLVIHIFGPYIWRCSVDHFIKFYKENLSNHHADIGVGTGYFLENCGANVSVQNFSLFDININCLNYSKKRLEKYSPKTYIQHALKPFPKLNQEFNSICIGGLIHCMPGTMSTKCHVFDTILAITKKETRIFGYTLCRQ